MTAELIADQAPDLATDQATAGADYPAGPSALLAIDQGTSSSRAMVFGPSGEVIAMAQQEFAQCYPRNGWVEHQPEDIWQSVLQVTEQALASARAQGFQVLSAGISNQRETVIVWNRSSGAAIYNAIVWQDRRTAEVCDGLRLAGAEADLTRRTGLLLDPYFSATKIAWILDHVPGARAQAERGELAAGTVDAFLIWRFNQGQCHLTDATNASRTCLYDIHLGAYSQALLELFRVPHEILPEVRNSVDDFGHIAPEFFGQSIPLGGVAGDQQAATVGQCCFAPGNIKTTYGTGGFVMLNTGAERVHSTQLLLSTLAYQFDGVPTYAVEGSIFVAGAALQWLRDGLGVIGQAAEAEALAASLTDNEGVYMVPAFTGLGAPHWDPAARGSLLGLTRDTGPAHLARAALESVVYQTSDLLDAMAMDGQTCDVLRVDGGMVANSWFCQFLADLLNKPVDRPQVMETSALGAAFLAGLSCGVYSSIAELPTIWRRQQRFEPAMTAQQRQQMLAGWSDAVRRTLSTGP